MNRTLKKSLASLVLLTASVAALAVNPSGTLPVLYIETPDHKPIDSKEVYVDNTKYWLDPMGDASVEAIGTKENPKVMQIRGRGNYTWTGFQKKPYRLKLADKQPMLGMNKSKHWALMANADDRLGFLRSPLMFHLSQLCGLAWTPAERPVEVVLNGNYIGLYFLTETIRVDKDRVNIVEQADDSDTDVTGGWLLEIDNYDDPDQIQLTEGDGSTLRITYKSPEVLSTAQRNFLVSQMEAINDAFYQTDPASTDWETLVDKESLAAYYVVEEMLDNFESFHGSCYFYRNQGQEQKWTWGPVWDSGSVYLRENGDFMYNSHWHQTWIPQVVKFTAFQEAYKSAFERFLADHYASVPEFIRAYAARIAKAVEADAQRWPEYANSDEAAKASEIIALWKNRVKWLCDKWDVANPADRSSGIYIRGEMTGWAPLDEWEFESTSTPGVYEIYDVTLDSQFKIADKDWKTVNYGTSGGVNPKPDELFELTRGAGSENMYINGTFPVVRLTIDPETLDATLLMLTKGVGIDTVDAADSLITLQGRVLTAAGAPLRLYTLQGVAVAEGSSIEVATPGIYIAVAGSTAQKILVK